MALNFGKTQMYATLGAVPVMVAAAVFMHLGGIKLMEYQILGLLVPLGLLLVIFLANCIVSLIAYHIEQRNKIQELQVALDEKRQEDKRELEVAESKRKDKEQNEKIDLEKLKLQAEIAEKRTKLALEEKKQTSELKIEEAKEIAAIEMKKSREQREADTERRKTEFLAIGEALTKRTSHGPIIFQQPNNLSKD